MALKRSEVELISLTKIEPNPFQPRKIFKDEDIKDLAESIKSIGLVQKPTVIPKVDENMRPIEGEYYLIAGERRLRAYKKLAEETGEREYRAIEAIVIPVDQFPDKNSYEMRLILDSFVENIDRVDLTPVEKAEAILEIQKKTGRTYKQIGEDIGKSEGYIKNMISTYKKLTEEEREEVKKKKYGTRKINELIAKKRPQKPKKQPVVGGNDKHIGETSKEAQTGSQGGSGVFNTALDGADEDYESLTSDQKFERLSLFLEKLLKTEDMNEKLSFITEFVTDYAEEK